MNLEQLRKDYGSDWTIRDQPPSATRRQQLGQVDPEGKTYTPPGLTMNLYATDLPDLAKQLAEQTARAQETD